MRNVILFDFGGVLEIHGVASFCDWLKEEFNLSSDILPIYKKWEYLRDIDELDEHEFHKRFTKDVGIDISEDDFYNEYYSNHVKQCFDVLDFIEKELFGKYDLFIFSNNSRITVNKFQEKTGFERLFNKCVYSYYLHTQKPDIEFFRKGLELIGHDGEECIFFDDQIKSKENSEKLGIKFIQYKDLDQLKKDLKYLIIYPGDVKRQAEVQ